jgi:hypothetical protein
VEWARIIWFLVMTAMFILPCVERAASLLPAIQPALLQRL